MVVMGNNIFIKIIVIELGDFFPESRANAPCRKTLLLKQIYY